VVGNSEKNVLIAKKTPYFAIFSNRTDILFCKNSRETIRSVDSIFDDLIFLASINQ
jgi:hypothetical protein